MHEFTFPVFVKKEGDKYIAGCPNLRAFSHHDNEREAVSSAIQVMFYIIQDAIDSDGLDNLLSLFVKPIEHDEPNEMDMSGFQEACVLKLHYNYFSTGVLHESQAKIENPIHTAPVS